MSEIARQIQVEDEDGWQTVLSYLPPGWEDKMRETGAFSRARRIKSPSDLLRILFAPPVLPLSLPELSRWAAERGLARRAFPSLWERLQKCVDFLRWLIGALLQPDIAFPAGEWVMAPVDATSFTLPASTKREWLLHMTWANGYPLAAQLRKVGGKGSGESLKNLDDLPPEVVRVADRAYGTPPQLTYAAERGQRFLTRFTWNNLPLFADGEGQQRLDPLTLLGDMIPGETREFAAWVRAKGEKPLHVRVVVVRKSPQAAAQTAKRSQKESTRKGHQPRELTLFLSGFVTLVTNLSLAEADTRTVAEAYRWRWQIEREFKRFKSTTQVRRLPNHKDASVQVYLLALLAVWLLANRMARQNVFFPWGLPLRRNGQAGEAQP
jgi:hypothetical protein